MALSQSSSRRKKTGILQFVKWHCLENTGHIQKAGGLSGMIEDPNNALPLFFLFTNYPNQNFRIHNFIKTFLVQLDAR